MTAIVDVIERKLKPTLQQNDYLKLFIAQAPVAVAMFDRDMRYIIASHRWLSDYGLGKRDITGLSHYEVFPNLPDHWRAALRHALNGETITAKEERFERADGTVQWLHCEIQPWYDGSSQGGIIIFTENITDRKRAEQLFRATIEAAPIGIVMSDSTGTIVVANAEAETLFGYSRSELSGQQIDALVPKRLRSSHAAYRARYFAKPAIRPMGAGRDLFGVRKDGSELPIEISLSHAETDTGIFILNTIIDITKRKQQEQELQQYNEQLTASNLELQRFAYVASHDFQSPMRSIASFIELLRVKYIDKLDAQALGWIDRTLSSVKHLRALIDDLLNYSRIDKQNYILQRVGLNDVFDEAVALLADVLHENGASVECGMLPTVMGHRIQLVQLLSNLIGNALKYRCDAPPRIYVSAELNGKQWTISVRDNGIGIAPQYHERIFEMFQRLHDQHEYPGTGIGLAVCRRIVEAHGGKIWVTSEVGSGQYLSFHDN